VNTVLRSGDRKHFFHSGEPEQFLNTRVDACNAQSNPFALTPRVMTGQHAEAGRIHIRNSPQVKSMCRWGLIVCCRFEDVAKGIRRQRVVHISRCQRPGKSKDRAVRFAFAAFDCKSCARPYLRFDRWHGIFPLKSPSPEELCAGVSLLERLRGMGDVSSAGKRTEGKASVPSSLRDISV
jgi:hypothetical protein